MSETFSFEEIAFDWRVPGNRVEIRPDRRRQGLYTYPARTLLIAPKLASGTGALLTPQRITRVDDAVARAGEGSIAVEMVERFTGNNSTGDLWLLLMEDPSGGAARATYTLTITGTPAAGTLVCLVGGRRVSIPVNAGESPTVIAARLVAAITALTGRRAMPVTAANTAGVVTLTVRHYGTVGNHLRIVLNPDADLPLPVGLSVAVATGAAGTGEADIAPVLSAIATQWWTDMVLPILSTGYMTVMPAELDRRWNAMVRLDAHVWGMQPGSFSALTTLGNARNSRFITEIGADASPSPPWAWAAALAGRAGFHLLNDPARQLRSLPLVGILPPPPASRFIETERDLLLRDGISTFTVTDDDQVILERVITQNQRTGLGVEDTAWLDVMTVKVLSRIRYDWISYMNATWPRPKLADDGDAAADYDREIATPRRLHNSWAARCKLYERQGWIQQVQESVAESVFVRDVNDRTRVNALLRVRILGNLMTLHGVLEFSQ